MVAIHVRGVLAFNSQALDALEKPEAVELFYDRDAMIIGMKGASRSSPDSYVVRHHTRNSAQIAGQSFLEYYDIPPEVRGRRYRAEVQDEMLTVDLRQEPEE
jgi:hypothetical protein